MTEANRGGAARLGGQRPGSEEQSYERAKLWLEWSRDGAVLATVQGHGLPEVAEVIARRWDAASRTCDDLQLLLDFSAMPTYETAFRKTLTNSAVAHRPRLRSIDLLSGSTLVTMGAGVANLVLGGMVRVHSSESKFDACVRGATLSPRRR